MGALSGDEPKDTPVDAKTFLREFQNAFQGMGMRIISGRLRFLIPPKKWLASCNVVHTFVDYFIEKASKARQARLKDIDGDENDLAAHHHSVLEGLVELTEDRVEIRNHILQGMMAAQETTSVLLSTTFFLLSRSPPAWSKLREEAHALSSAGMTFDNLRSSRILRNILNECRLIIIVCHPLRKSL